MSSEKEITDKHAAEHVEIDDDVESGKPKYAANAQMDEAARILAEAGPREFSAQDKKRVLRKIDFWVCLPMGIVYCMYVFHFICIWPTLLCADLAGNRCVSTAIRISIPLRPVLAPHPYHGRHVAALTSAVGQVIARLCSSLCS